MTYTYKDFDFTKKNNFKIALMAVPGIGFSRASYLCDLVGISVRCSVSELGLYLFFVLLYVLKQYYGTDVLLRRIRENNLKGFLSFKSYKSIRFSAGLPVRGQHTHNNAKTAKRTRHVGSYKF